MQYTLQATKIAISTQAPATAHTSYNSTIATISHIQAIYKLRIGASRNPPRAYNLHRNE